MCLCVPGKVVAIIDADTWQADVSIAGVHRRANIMCVADTGTTAHDYVGAWVIVHAGFALSRLDEAQAQETLRLLTEMTLGATQ